MKTLSRRELLKLAAVYGASLALPSSRATKSNSSWREAAEFFPHGVASGDPRPGSVLLWTRRAPVDDEGRRLLIVEVASDQRFQSVVSRATAMVSKDGDWTCRVLVARLKPSTVYWYRFTDDDGNGSRVGRTITAPADDDARPVRFTFVSCQNAQMGAMNAYRRMLLDDEARPVDDRLQFVLHLGDFVYEVTWYPEDRARYYARTVRDTVRYANGEKIADFHIPTTVDDYRALYRAYLTDPDLQDARAHWPFVCMWDNHEFSWKGWQSLQNFGSARAAQTRKVAANQAWFEYQPARIPRVGAIAAGDDRFRAPSVRDAAITTFDDFGFGQETDNVAAVESLRVYRAFRFGANVEMILTDNRAHRSEPPMNRPDGAAFRSRDFPAVVPEEVVGILDAGREAGAGVAPATIAYAGKQVGNFRAGEPPSSMLGRDQRDWFLRTLKESTAPWKLWGNSVALLDWRIDFQNLPEGSGPAWPGASYAQMVDDDWSAYRHARGEVLDFLRREKIGGVVSFAGDRHAFMAGVQGTAGTASSDSPAVAEFVTGSVSAPGISEAMEFNVPPAHPLHAIYAAPGMTMPCLWGVRSALTFARTGELAAAARDRNADLAPGLSFADASGHGFVFVRASRQKLDAELVCIARPVARADDGGPLRYRLRYALPLWTGAASPALAVSGATGELPPGAPV